MSKKKPGISFFNQHAKELAAQYNALDRTRVHDALIDLLPNDMSGLSVLDIGAGSGADAFLFASRGCHVVATEPASTLRKLAQSVFPHPSIEWSGASLPSLRGGKFKSRQFDVVTATGVFQYLDDKEREKAFYRMAYLVKEDGLIELQYPTPASRIHQYDVPIKEVRGLVKQFNEASRDNMRLEICVDRLSPDLQGRAALNGAPLSFATFVIKKIKNNKI